MELEKQNYYRILSIPVTILAILLVYYLKIPNPMMILIIPVVFFTYSDGFISGTLSAATTVLYSYLFFFGKLPGQAIDGRPVEKIITTITLAVTVIIILVGKLKSRNNTHTERIMQQSAHFAKILSGMEAYLYASDMETDELIFVNDKLKKLFGIGVEVIGEPCWKVFRSLDKRCEFCPKPKLLLNPGEPVIWEEYIMDAYFKSNDSVIDWPDGRKVHLQERFDITDMKQAEEDLLRMSSIVNSSPNFASYKKITGECLFISPAASVLTGYSHDELMEDYLGCMFDEETAGRLRDEIPAALIEKGVLDYELSFKRKDGETRILSVSSFLVEAEEKAFSTIATDITEKKRIETEKLAALALAEKRERLLYTVNNAAAILLQSEISEFENDLRRCMGMVAESVDADRVYLWKNHVKDGELYCTQIYEWSEGAEPQQGGEYTVDIPYRETGREWNEKLSGGQCVNGLVREMSPHAREFLSPQGILSILVVPVFLQDQFWGFVGFNDCHRERLFSEEEEAILRSVSLLFSNALLRNETMRELKTRDNLLQAVNTMARFLLETEQEYFMDTLRQSLMTLAQCTGAKHVSIWRSRINEQNILTAVRYAGVVAGIQPDMDLEDIEFDFSTYLPEWENEPYDDINLSAEDLNENLRNTKMMKHCKSLLILPQNVQGGLWGFMAYAHQSKAYLYSGAEKNILRSGGDIIATAIMRHEISLGLHAAVKATQAASRAKSEFLSRMSHEMRTPMTAIIGMTGIAKNSKDLEKKDYCLDKIDSASKHLLGIINDILDMSKIEANKFELSCNQFNFEKMLMNIIDIITFRIDEKKQNIIINLDKNLPSVIASDEQRLGQVIENLLVNAIKFSPEGGAITLNVSVTDKLDDVYTILTEVTDNGIGIAKDAQSGLFTAFEQADGGVARKYGGTGLGLAICKQIVERMGGKIWVESELGHGSKFSFTIIAKKGKEQSRTALSSRVKKEELRVLAVDDSLETREYFLDFMQTLGIPCDVAEDGTAALSMIKAGGAKPYNIIFVDYFMPDMNGAELTKKILEIAGESIAVIMISAALWSDIEKDAVSAGVIRFIPKPLFPSALIDVINECAAGALNRQVDEPEDAGGSGGGRQFTGKTILLAEDVEINRVIVQEILSETGLNIECAENGLQALEMVRSQPGKYGLILMDINMPEMDGYTAARLIRGLDHSEAASIPIIAMTANVFQEDIEKCLKAGMNDHIGKPINTEEIFTKIDRYLPAG